MLPELARFHLGDTINVFRHGSLVMQNVGERTTPINGCVLYGTCNGAIGIVTQIPQDFYDFLHGLEERLKKIIKSVGKIDHTYYRNYQINTKVEPSEGFIDGDLIESFLDLNRDKMREAVSGLEVCIARILNQYYIKLNLFCFLQLTLNGERKSADVEDVIKIVEDLTRMH